MIPLVKLPRRVVYVDDRGEFLQVMRKALPSGISRQFSPMPKLALQSFRDEMSFWFDLEEVLSYAAHLQPSEVPRLFIKQYFNAAWRFSLSSVLVVDYAMPDMNGLDMIESLGDWPGRKILLTGEADASVAIKAFNKGQIQQFIPKTTPNLLSKITESSEDLHESVCMHMGQILRQSLSHDDALLLAEPEISQSLRRLIEDLNWTEYLAVGSPLGLLGTRRDGPLQWLQIETNASVRDLGRFLEEYGYPTDVAKQVMLGQSLCDHELKSCLDLLDDVRVQPAVDLGKGAALAAVFDLNIPILTASEYGLDDVLTPAEQIRALIKACRFAYLRWRTSTTENLSQEPHGEGERKIREVLDQTIENLKLEVVLTAAHRAAYAEALHTESLPPDLRGMLPQPGA